MISGIGTAVGLFYFWGKPHIPVSAAIAMVVPLLVMPVVSFLTSPPDEAHLARCFPTVKGKPSTNPELIRAAARR
jgi:hypothetical protein